VHAKASWTSFNLTTPKTTKTCRFIYQVRGRGGTKKEKTWKRDRSWAQNGTYYETGWQQVHGWRTATWVKPKLHDWLSQTRRNNHSDHNGYNAARPTLATCSRLTQAPRQKPTSATAFCVFRSAPSDSLWQVTVHPSSIQQGSMKHAHQHTCSGERACSVVLKYCNSLVKTWDLPLIAY